MLTLVGKEAKVPGKRRQAQGEVTQPCPFCSDAVKMVTAEQAAIICQCSRRKIYRWIDEGAHYVERPDGTVLICGRSLAEKLELLNSSTDTLDWYATREMAGERKGR